MDLLDDVAKRLFRPQERSGGLLVAICGFDGSGKTTQLERLERLLRDDGYDVLRTRQPTDWYREQAIVRSFLDEGVGGWTVRAMALMAAADRLCHCETVIRPALSSGKIVLCDRYVYSSLVLFSARGLDAGFLCEINAGIVEPEVAIYLDVPSPVLRERLRARDGEMLKFEERSAETIERITCEFRKLAPLLEPVDGTAPEESVTDLILSKIRHRFLSRDTVHRRRAVEGTIESG